MLKLSPSDFAFLYEECKLCYYLKVKHGIYQPSIPMPGVFSAINTRLQTPLVGKNLHDLSKDLPAGEIVSQEGWVESKAVPGANVFIKGKYDLLAKRGEEDYMLVDLKISQAGEDKIEKYKTQLGAYKFALENPAHGKPIKISKMGLLVLYPDKSEFENGVAKITFPPTWLEVPVDKDHFIKFAQKVHKLLDGDPPEEGKDCKWCAYRHQGDEISHKLKKEKAFVQEDIPF